MNLKVCAFVCTHVGKVRTNNEDNFFMNGLSLDRSVEKKGFLRKKECADPVQLYAVCDGMGGQAAGEEASALGVDMMRRLLSDLAAGEDVRAATDRCTALANDAVAALHKDAGSTLTLLCIKGDGATVAWLGDSRAYLLRDGKLLRLTQDHTEEQRMLKMGIQSAPGRAKNALTRYLGMDMPGLVVTPSYADEITVKKRDVFLLCSDGLSNLVEEERIAEILDSSEWPARELVDEALAAGGTDNVTALVVDIEKLIKPLFGAKK
jgi:protein phosphatase